jgi:molybdopterin/thiamine biosynthesis adenylyltransferase
MITIPTEYLDEHWSTLISTSILHITLNEWDEGDAYVLSSMGQFHSSKKIDAVIVIGDTKISGVPIVIRLDKMPNDNISYNYTSPEGSLYTASAHYTVTDTKNQPIDINVVNIANTLSLRRKGILESDLLKDSAVTIVGLGTGGVQVALELAKSGIGKFHLIDPDRLDVGNTCRHQAGISSVGRKKVLVGRDLILEKNPKAVVTTYPILACEKEKETLTSIIKNSDLVICATDSRKSKLFINSLCVETKKPVIFGGAFRRAYGGNILRVHPSESACYHCFVLAMPEKELDQEISSEDNASDIAYSDMPVAIEPGLSLDISPIGIMVSKLALQELIKNKPSTLHILDKDFEANWYFWINRPEPKTDYTSLPPLSESYDEMTILRWYAVTLSKDPNCPTCGDFTKALSEQYGFDLNTIKPPTTRSDLPKGIF